MATGWAPEGLSEEEIADGEAYHRALYRDGSLESPVSWHRDSVERLIDLVLPHIPEGGLVVDYGSGTGGSVIELLKAMDEKGVSAEIVLIDPLVSWFAKARDILGHREGIHFELSIGADDNGRMRFRRLEEMLSGRQADAIISSSTLHLVPAKAMGDLALQFAGCLAPDGVLAWDSGDLECDFRPRDSVRLHDPYREVREILRSDEARLEALEKISSHEAERSERRLDRIFPLPFPVEVILDSMTDAGFTSQVSDKVVEFSKEDAQNFILVPRLAEIAAPLLVGSERDEAILTALESALSSIAGQGRGTESGYRSHWVYGIHKLKNG